MLKRSFIICIVICCTAITTHAQTLKITDVTSSNDKMYKDVAANALGKNLVLTIYDKSVKVEPSGQKSIILREQSEDYYYDITEENGGERWTASLTVNKSLGVVTSAVLIITVSQTDKGIMNKSASCTITAKRF